MHHVHCNYTTSLFPYRVFSYACIRSTHSCIILSVFVMEAQCTFHEIELKILSFLIPYKEKWTRYKTIVLSLCKPVRGRRCKVFSPLTHFDEMLSSWFRASKFNVNKNPTRCNSMQIFIYCKVTLHVSGVTAPIIRSTKN